MRAWALYFKAPTQRQHSRSAAAASLRFVLGTVGNGRKARRVEPSRNALSAAPTQALPYGTGAQQCSTERIMFQCFSPIVGVLRTRHSCSFSEVTLCSHRVCSGCTCNPQKVQLQYGYCDAAWACKSFCADWKRAAAWASSEIHKTYTETQQQLQHQHQHRKQLQPRASTFWPGPGPSRRRRANRKIS